MKAKARKSKADNKQKRETVRCRRSRRQHQRGQDTQEGQIYLTACVHVPLYCRLSTRVHHVAYHFTSSCTYLLYRTGNTRGAVQAKQSRAGLLLTAMVMGMVMVMRVRMGRTTSSGTDELFSPLLGDWFLGMDWSSINAHMLHGRYLLSKTAPFSSLAPHCFFPSHSHSLPVPVPCQVSNPRSLPTRAEWRPATCQRCTCSTSGP